MQATIEYNKKEYHIDLSKPIDISMTLKRSKDNVSAWYVGKPKIKPIRIGSWVGKVKKGAAVNFNSIKFSPHSHGTHTECVGHITKEFYSVNDSLKQFVFFAELVTIAPGKLKNDFVITKKQLELALKNNHHPEAIIIRTLPNTEDKLKRQYSNTNPPYLLEEAVIYLKELGIKHLLIDLPSIDKEKDDGKLLAHNAFWNTAGKIRFEATITEFIFVSNTIKDGTYILNLQIAPFHNDASPSKPILYGIIEKT
ncbi:cyclase family protein [Flavobacteriaceae bacterium AU392]|nr:cyclase family protein [Flavobacteriaceae bacterium]RKM84169.1 cyclase family protein [Flavobacteriaceae bacterium AU392]